jgi:predicted DNA binding CopG/RHH family protein
MKTKQIGLRLSIKLIDKYKRKASELDVNYMDLIKIALAEWVNTK